MYYVCLYFRTTGADEVRVPCGDPEIKVVGGVA